MTYAKPGTKGAIFTFKKRYDNFIGGDWVVPYEGAYFENKSPVDGNVYCEVARSSDADLQKALDAAHAAFPSWGQTSIAERSNILLKIADIIETNLETLAHVDTWDNRKGIRETLNADVPLAADYFLYFAGCCARKKAQRRISTRQLWPIIIMSRLVLLARSFLGISHFPWRLGSLLRRLQRAIALSPNLRNKLPFPSLF